MAEVTPTAARTDSTAGPSAPAPAQAPYVPDADIHLLDRFAILYRYRRIAITVFILTTAVLMIQGYTNVKVFQARAQLLIEDERSTAVPGINSAENTFYEDPEPYYNTQFRILKGRDLARRVVRRLKLETIPEFNGTAVPPPTPVSMIRDFQTRLMGLIRKPAAPAPPETPKVDETPDESGLVSAFIGRVTVEPIRTSRLVDVTFMSADPNFAALAVNTLVDEYAEQNLAIKLESSQNMLGWLAKELDKQQQKVRESEQALAEYRDKQNAMSLDDKQNIVTTRLTALNDALIRARTAKVQKEALYNQVRSMSGTTAPDAIPVIAQNVQVQTLKNKLNELQRDKSRLEERYGPKHLAVQANATAIQDTRSEE